MQQHNPVIERAFAVEPELLPFFTHLGEKECLLIESVSHISAVIQDHLQHLRFDEVEECLQKRRLLLHQLTEKTSSECPMHVEPDRASKAKKMLESVNETNKTLMQLLLVKQNQVLELIHNVQNEKMLQVYKR
jgi:hypothetical protein